MSTHRAGRRDELAHARWITSSRSGTGGGNCVQVAHLHDGHRAVRDSKNPIGPALIVAPAAWATFTAGVRDGEPNLLSAISAKRAATTPTADRASKAR